MDATERLERLAKQFSKETGFLAPFKDAPTAVGNDPHYDQTLRQQEWDKWMKVCSMTVREELLLSPEEICGNCTNFTIHGSKRYPCNVEDCTRYKERRNAVQSQLDKVLKDKRIRVEAENQELPDPDCFEGKVYSESMVQDMLTPKDGCVWVKCEIK